MRLWLLTEDWATSQIAAYPKNSGRVLNGAQVFDASIKFNASLPGDGPWSAPYPPDFPTPRVRFAEGRLPDYNRIQNLAFVSDRLRRAMDLPDDVVQFLPIKNLNRPPRARVARYSLLHVLASARAVDGERSECHLDRYRSAKTGAEVLELAGLTLIRFLPDFAQSCDLFREAAAPTITLVTDALAQRVISAGCTGVQFRHPLWFAPGFDEVIKTGDGAARLVWDQAGRSYSLAPFPIEEADAGPSAATGQPRFGQVSQ